MLETPHVAVGAAIASKIPNPLIAIPLAFASHFILDMTPHWNPHLNTEIKKYGKVTTKTKQFIILDVVVALGVGGFFAYRALPDTNHALVILAASFASVLPDVIEGPNFFLGMKSKAITQWIKLQKAIQNDAGLLWGLTTQVVTIAAAVLWVFSS